jgi:hypothetical protein
MPSEPEVIDIMTPRERLSWALPSLHSLYAAADLPFDLVSVDTDSPKHIRRALDRDVNHDAGQNRNYLYFRTRVRSGIDDRVERNPEPQ